MEGLRSDDIRSSGDFHHPGIPLSHPDLTAWWRFDEPGFVVRDVTGKGHDLTATAEPQFRVVRWLTRCGDGVMQGIESCDDGNRVAGDGCSPSCSVEPGFLCTGTQPSLCYKSGGEIPHPRPGPPPPTPGGGGGGSSGGSSGGWFSPGRVATILLGIVLVPVVGFGVVATWAFSTRHQYPASDVLAQQITHTFQGTFIERAYHRLFGGGYERVGSSATAEPAGPANGVLQTPPGSAGRYAVLPGANMAVTPGPPGSPDFSNMPMTPDFSLMSPERGRARGAQPLFSSQDRSSV